MAGIGAELQWDGQRFGIAQRLVDKVVIGRQPANGIGRGGIAGEQKRLAAAAAEVDFPAIAEPAWFGHPVDAAKSLEHRRVKPDVVERGFTHVWKFKPGDLAPIGREEQRRPGLR